MPFRDRAEAGRRLGQALQDLRGEDVVVLGLPRGGVPVAFEVAGALDAPLDVIVVRKLGVPFQPELAMGAIGEDGVRIVNGDVVRVARVTEGEFAVVEERERAELTRQARRFRRHRPREPLTGRTAVVVDDGIATGSTARAACHVAHAHGASRVVLAIPVAPPGSVAELRRRELAYRGDRPPVPLTGAVAVLVDDGLATGATAAAAIQAARARGPAAVVLAVPVGAAEIVRRLEGLADEVVCAATPSRLVAVGRHYVDFSEVSDKEVRSALAG